VGLTHKFIFTLQCDKTQVLQKFSVTTTQVTINYPECCNS